MTARVARARARKLIEKLDVGGPPINVEQVAERLGADVVQRRFEGAISAMLYRSEGERPIIGINQSDSPARRRFSIAHEIGHLVMHPGRPLIVDGLRVNFRDEASSAATFPEEIEANAFAAELLMPENLVVANFESLAEELTEREMVQQLKKRFDVSAEAMRYRLVNLGLATSL